MEDPHDLDCDSIVTHRPLFFFRMFSATRLGRTSPSLACIVGMVLALCSIPAAQAFDFNDVAAKAKALAQRNYEAPAKNLPRELENLSFDAYRDIRYRPEKFLWRNNTLPFEIAFFHQGYFFDRPVKINEVNAQGVREIRFNPADFTYGANKVDPAKLRNLGFAGFRIHFPINTPKYKDEIISFLGATYFRALGKNQHYGQSARGLAIDTALSSGEEFPHFVEYWLVRPAAGAREIVVYALLDSRRATGAYRFTIRPGDDTIVDVKTRLFLRSNVSKLGIAPLTSMFYFGENQPPAVPDFRPEAHDSDGLSIHSGTGEWIWRPLVNPKRLLVTSFALSNPQGFGLLQRDRRFASYEDLALRYETRPGVWIQPKGKWGAGRVELVQIPTPDETNDNIVAQWIPDTPPAPKQPYDLEYRMLWQKDNEPRPNQAWVTQTRRGHGWGHGKPDDSELFVVDFEGTVFKALGDKARIEPVVSGEQNVQILNTYYQRNEATGGGRMNIRIRRVDADKPVELRGYLRNGNIAISETWSYILPPS